MRVLLALALVGSLQAQGALSPIDMFYDPAGAGAQSTGQLPEGNRLRAIPVVRPFPPYGNVGIHYWFENDAGARLTEAQAAAAHVALTLHVRSNTDGFLTVWLIKPAVGTQLTPAEDRGYPLAVDTEYVVPGHVEFGSGDSAGRLILLYSRSQTEVAKDPAHAGQRLQTFSSRTAPDGLPQLVRGTDSGTPGQVGTYVVNRRGSPIGAEVSLQFR
jgi:hypothetical protein